MKFAFSLNVMAQSFFTLSQKDSFENIHSSLRCYLIGKCVLLCGKELWHFQEYPNTVCSVRPG